MIFSFNEQDMLDFKIRIGSIQSRQQVRSSSRYYLKRLVFEKRNEFVIDKIAPTGIRTYHLRTQCLSADYNLHQNIVG